MPLVQLEGYFMFQLPTSPSSIGKILDSGFKLYRMSLFTIFPYLLISSAFALVPQFLIEPATSPIDPNDPLSAINFSAEIIGISLLSFLGMFVFILAAVKRVDSFSKGQSENFSSAVIYGIRKLPIFALSTVVFGVLVMLGFVLLIIPGIILMFSTSLYFYAIVIENKGIISSITRSHKLIWGNWWRSATVISVPWVVYIIIYLAMLGVAALFVDIPDFEAGMENITESLPLSIAEALLTSLIGSLIYAVTIVQFNDLKLRKEGGDLASKLEAIKNTD